MKTIRAANRRARQRGVDLMEINPRPLRARRRLTTTPSQMIQDSWQEVFNTIDETTHKLKTK